MGSLKRAEKIAKKNHRRKLTGVGEFFNRVISGIIAGLIVLILLIFGRVRIKGFSLVDIVEALKDGRGLIIICNHPSMTETFILPALFTILFIFSRRYLPISTPDTHFFHAWWFTPFRFACIPIIRDDSREAMMAALEMKELLKAGGILIVFAEGGRTHKGEEKEMVVSKCGNRVRSFKRGLESVIRKSNARIMCVWTEGGDKIIRNVAYKGKHRWLPFPRLWNVIRFRFGKAFSFSELDQEDPMADLEECVLGLGDSLKYERFFRR